MTIVDSLRKSTLDSSDSVTVRELKLPKKSSIQKSKELFEKLSKATTDFQQLAVASIQGSITAQLCNPEGSSNTSSQESLLKLGEMEVRYNELETSHNTMSEVAQSMKNSQIGNYLESKIHYDDSFRTFNGRDLVVFNYSLQALKDNQRASINVSIYDSESNQVYYNNKVITTNKVDNTFTWDGKNLEGKLLESGRYSITITATCEDKKVPIDVQTYKQGVVKSIEYNEDGEALLILHNGSKISPSEIRKIDSKGDKNDNISADSYIKLIGHDANINLTKFKINEGRGIVTYNNELFPKNSLVDLDVAISTEKGSFVKVVKIPKIGLEDGIGKLTIDGITNKLDDGQYTAVIHAKAYGDDSAALQKLDNQNLKVSVAGVNIINKTLQTKDGKVLPLYNVEDFGDVTLNDDNLITNIVYNKANSYIGKQVTYLKDTEYYDGNPINIDVQQKSPPTGYKVGGIIMRISDQEGNTIRTISKSAADVNYSDKISVPSYNDLSNSSKMLVQKFWAENLGISPNANYTGFNFEKKAPIAQYITKNFKAGILCKNAEETDEHKLANMGVTRITWDGNNDTGSRVTHQGYKVEIETSLIRDADNEVLRSSYPRYVSAHVTNYDVDNDKKITLNLADGNKLSLSDVIEVR